MESMSSTQTTSSSSSTPGWKHEVFLSFYGEDTRKSFTDHLYAALIRKNILAFRDDEKLERGKYISQELLKAIQQSLYSIVVISENYAFSKWCLIELAEIVECMREKRLKVLPVFYHVDPSDVRNQTGTFADAFLKHEKNTKVEMEKMQTWRDALTEVGNISGWHLHDGHESTVIQEITRSVFSELKRRFSSISSKLVGIDTSVEEMMTILGMGFDDVRFIGIHGLPGVGKTTLAEVMYDRVSYQFEASSFIACLREETRNRGLLSLQKQLLSDIMKGEKDTFDDREVNNVIRNRLRNRKVFIVLDDVDGEKQLEALAGSPEWFGPGSRIIFTSRNSHLLKRHGVKDIYQVEELNDDEALKLFSLSAFKKPHPEENYVDVSMDFVNYAGGLPLALKVLGSFLFGRTTNAWKSARDQLEEIPNKEIFDILQISFDGLEDLQKKLFLDIACFFEGEQLDDILDILESFGYYPGINIDVLIDKSLLTISRGTLRMHDLLKKMGRTIVRLECLEEPGRRSRLWHGEDVLHVLKNNTGTDAVEGIVLELPKLEEHIVSVEAFSRMKKLRILKIGDQSIIETSSILYDKLCAMMWHIHPLESMPTNELRVMEWHGYPFKSLPTSFQPDNLIELRLPCSRIEQWKTIKSLGNLKLFDLSGSLNLIETPDFSGSPNLEYLFLAGCKRLSKVHPSIGVLKRLLVLNLDNCKRLKSLPDNISLESLESFHLDGCSRLEKFPDILGNMTSLKCLLLDGTAIKELPLSFKTLSCLSILFLNGCNNLSILPSFMSSLSTLKSLHLSGCSRLERIPDLSSMESLDELYLVGTAITQLAFLSLLPKKIRKLKLCGSKSRELDFYRYSLLKTSSDPISISFLWNIGIDPINLSYLWYASTIEYSRCCGTDCKRHSIEALYIYYDSKRGNILQGLRSDLRIGDLVGTNFCATIISGCSLGYRIPVWFNNRSKDSSVTLEMYLDLVDNWKWKRYALFIVYEIQEHENLNYFWILEGSDFPSLQFICHFETDEGPLLESLFLVAPKVPFVGTIRFWVYIPIRWFSQRGSNLDGWSYIKASIRADSPDVEVKQCGARLVCQQDASELYDAITRDGLDFESVPDIYSQWQEEISREGEAIVFDFWRLLFPKYSGQVIHPPLFISHISIKQQKSSVISSPLSQVFC